MLEILMEAECNYWCGSSRMAEESLHGSANNMLTVQMKNIHLLSRAIISALSQTPLPLRLSVRGTEMGDEELSVGRTQL